MFKSVLGMRLVLRIGPNIAQPASYEVSTALTHVEVPSLPIRASPL